MNNYPLIPSLLGPYSLHLLNKTDLQWVYIRPTATPDLAAAAAGTVEGVESRRCAIHSYSLYSCRPSRTHVTPPLRRLFAALFGAPLLPIQEGEPAGASCCCCPFPPSLCCVFCVRVQEVCTRSSVALGALHLVSLPSQYVGRESGQAGFLPIFFVFRGSFGLLFFLKGFK